MSDERTERIPRSIPAAEQGDLGVESRGEFSSLPDAAAALENPASANVALEGAAILAERPHAASAQKIEKDPFVKTIEGILEGKFGDDEDLGRVMAGLPDEQRRAFIAASEIAATEILAEVRRPHPRYEHVLTMIERWLGRLPLLNKDFLRQEAKIKTDQIIAFVHADADHHALAA